MKKRFRQLPIFPEFSAEVGRLERKWDMKQYPVARYRESGKIVHMEIFVEFLKNGISPALRELLRKLIQEWEKAALKTKTPVDDLLVSFVKRILGL